MHRSRLDDPDLALVDLMNAWPETIPVFLRHRTLCVGCLVSPFHTVVDACAEHGLCEELFRAELRAAVRASAAPRQGPRAGAARTP